MDRRNFLRTASSFALLAAGATTGVSRVFAKTPSFSLTGNQSDENTPNMGDTMEYRKHSVSTPERSASKVFFSIITTSIYHVLSSGQM